MVTVYRITHRDPAETSQLLGIRIPRRPDSFLVLDGGRAFVAIPHPDAPADDAWGFWPATDADTFRHGDTITGVNDAPDVARCYELARERLAGQPA